MRWLDYINTFTAVFTLSPNHNIAADLLYIDDVINQLLSCFHKIYFIQAFCYCSNPNVVAFGVSRKNPRQKVPEETINGAKNEEI